jgi:hypothetical protein
MNWRRAIVFALIEMQISIAILGTVAEYAARHVAERPATHDIRPIKRTAAGSDRLSYI